MQAVPQGSVVGKSGVLLRRGVGKSISPLCSGMAGELLLSVPMAVVGKRRGMLLIGSGPEPSGMSSERD